MKTFTNFSFHMYTEIAFGKGTENQVADLVKKYGGTKVMMVYGGGSVKKAGLYDTVVAKLNEAKIPFVELPGVQPNPRRSLVEKGLKIAQEQGVDFLLGLGGGSSIDTAKGIALGLANDGEYWAYYQGNTPPKMAPVGTIHTIAAAGSENSGSSVLLDDLDTHRKYGFMHAVCRPVFAIMNPEFTYSVPTYQKGVGAADIFAHTLMRYMIEPTSYLGDKYAESTLKTVVKYGPIMIANPTDYESHAEIMLAGSFSHNDVTSLGRSFPKKGGEHALETQLSGTYDTAHGAGLSVVMPPMLKYFVDHGEAVHINKVAQLAINVFGVEPDLEDIKATAYEGIARLRAWLRSIGTPLTLKELGVPKGDLEDVIAKCNCGPDGVIKAFLDMDKKAVAEIFTSVVE